MSKLFVAFLALGLLGALPVGAQAPQNPAAAAVREACKGDFQKYCKDVQPGGGRIIACLKQNRDSLTPTCQQAIDKAGAGR